MNAENPYANATLLPTSYDGEYGDGFLVGTGTPYELYIWSRGSGDVGFWFDWGLLNAPSTIQGPQGPQGPIGPTGARGSRWTAQTYNGTPNGIQSPQNNDQALDTATGNIYTYNGNSWVYSGNIKGIQGNTGPQGPQGEQGPQGIQGPTGPQGPQGQFIELVNELDSTDQLPSPDSVSKSTAYLIDNKIYMIADNDGDPQWVYTEIQAGAQIIVDGVSQPSVNLTNAPTINGMIQIGEDTTVSSNGSEITFIDLQTTSTNVNGTQIEGKTTIELPIASSDSVKVVEDGNVIKFNAVGSGQTYLDLEFNPYFTWEPVYLTADQAQLIKDTGASNIIVRVNNEYFRIADDAVEDNTLVYSHIGNTEGYNKLKLITIYMNEDINSWYAFLSVNNISTMSGQFYRSKGNTIYQNFPTTSEFALTFNTSSINLDSLASMQLNLNVGGTATMANPEGGSTQYSGSVSIPLPLSMILSNISGNRAHICVPIENYSDNMIYYANIDYWFTSNGQTLWTRFRFWKAHSKTLTGQDVEYKSYTPPAAGSNGNIGVNLEWSNYFIS